MWPFVSHVANGVFVGANVWAYAMWHDPLNAGVAAFCFTIALLTAVER